eukprot:1150479-Pelagomonas_calceolata.AAC.9
MLPAYGMPWHYGTKFVPKDYSHRVHAKSSCAKECMPKSHASCMVCHGIMAHNSYQGVLASLSQRARAKELMPKNDAACMAYHGTMAHNSCQRSRDTECMQRDQARERMQESDVPAWHIVG